MGRPTDAPKQTQLGIRFDEKTLSILDRFCEKEKISRAEGVRQAVKRPINPKDRIIAEAFGDYVVDRVYAMDRGSFEIDIAVRPIKEGEDKR